jgi:hypothetical protein
MDSQMNASQDRPQHPGLSPAEQAQQVRVKEWTKALAALGAIALGIAALVLINRTLEDFNAEARHYEQLYINLNLTRASIGDVGLFWGGYAAYASCCLFLFGWLGRFPITDSLWSSMVVAVVAVFFVFAPLFFFTISIHVPVHSDGRHIVCGSWLYPSAKPTLMCLKELGAASLLGLTAALAGILVPIGCMFFSLVTQAFEPKAGRTESQAKGEESRSGEDRGHSAGDAREQEETARSMP